MSQHLVCAPEDNLRGSFINRFYFLFPILYPEWIDARMSGALARIEYWEKEIEAINEGTSQVVLGRAHEMLAHARWRAEREFPQSMGWT